MLYTLQPDSVSYHLHGRDFRKACGAESALQACFGTLISSVYQSGEVHISHVEGVKGL